MWLPKSRATFKFFNVSGTITPASDIYSFGICALEMAALEIQGNGESGSPVTDEMISKTIDSLEDDQQKDFIRRCIQSDAALRPSAMELLFHPLLFEVHSLKLLAAHALVNSASKIAIAIIILEPFRRISNFTKISFLFTANISETITDEVLQRLYGPDTIVAEMKYPDRPPYQLRLSDIPVAEKLEKFVEDVK